MKKQMLTAQDIAAAVGGTVEGDPATSIVGLAPIDAAKKGALSFIAQERFESLLDETPAAAVLIGKNSEAHGHPCLIRVQDPYRAFVTVARDIFGLGRPVPSGKHKTAEIHPGAEIAGSVSLGAYSVVEGGAQIAADTWIGAHVVIESGVRIGRNCQIFSNVVLHRDVRIGDDVIIQAGSVVGSDGFGYVRDGERSEKIPHLGTVVLEDRVELGANCTIDRGTFGETRLRAGSKLDNLVHVAHNVEIGENTVIAAQTGISGSTRLGRGVIVAGQVGFVGHIDIGDRSIFGAQAGVTKSIPEGITVSGYPAKPHMQAKREEAALRRLPELLKKIRSLEKQVEESEKNGQKIR